MLLYRVGLTAPARLGEPFFRPDQARQDIRAQINHDLIALAAQFPQQSRRPA